MLTIIHLSYAEEKDMQMLRWAILGTGFISKTVADAINQSEGSRVEMIVGRNTDTLTAFQQVHNIPRQSLGYDAVFTDPNIDVIYVGAPNHVHHELTIKAAQNGKAVLSEKSLTTTMKDAHLLIESVTKNQTFFAEGLMYLAHPLYKRLAKILTDGRVGKLRAVNGYYAANIWEVVNPDGLGTLYNLGCYPASLLQFVIQTLCGEDAFTNRTLSGFGNLNTDNNIDHATASVRFENGVLANLQSTDTYGMAFGFSIAGDKGILRFKTNPWHAGTHNHLEWCEYGCEIEDIIIKDTHSDFYHQVKMVETALAKGEKQAPRPSPRLKDSLEIMAFLTEWEASCRAV
jgi:predicted dehydrogenase